METRALPDLRLRQWNRHVRRGDLWGHIWVRRPHHPRGRVLPYLSRCWGYLQPPSLHHFCGFLSLEAPPSATFLTASLAMNGPKGAMPACLRILGEKIIILDLPSAHLVFISIIDGLYRLLARHCKGASDLHTSRSFHCRRCADWLNLLLNLVLFESISQTFPKYLSSHAIIPQMRSFMTVRLSLCPLDVDIFLLFHCFCRYPGSSRWGGTLPFHFLLEHILVNGIFSTLVLSCLVVCTYVFYTMHRNSQYALTSIFFPSIHSQQWERRWVDSLTHSFSCLCMWGLLGCSG